MPDDAVKVALNAAMIACGMRRYREVDGCFSDTDNCDDTGCQCKIDTMADAKAAITAFLRTIPEGPTDTRALAAAVTRAGGGA